MMKRIKSVMFALWICLSFILTIASGSFVILYIFIKGFKSVDLEFLLSNPGGIPIGTEGGVFPAIIGSILLMLIAIVFASILAIATAVYIVFYCRSQRLENIADAIIQCMAGVPSIVLGLFGYSVMVVTFNMGRSLLSAGLTLGLMIFPFIQVRVEKAFQEFSRSAINASYSLGVSKVYTIFKLVLPQCRRDIVSSITLAGGFAMGAAAPIMLTGAVIFAPVPKSLSSPVMALPLHLYILANEGISMEKAYATALVLIALLIIINIFAMTLTLWRKEVKR
ncbi:PstA family ABC transporter permease [Lutispora thermophila]|uniref:Phosphate ABC transporter membrane protein 2, PhoT family n=1 Tax=Lutispora thermophila DSM 19022 TaxID=1122184 RepID=A0A1M6FFZ2_9FIRM|nr:ABC transporter permease subunit [Lutispora thermophila]SHI96566.1 phosphate ABC transporter membrane protein 2, PhoT family [Lutispora thermophila DSM 19022]